MKKAISLYSLLLVSGLTYAQPPQRPLLPLNTWSLPDYHAVDVSEAFSMPAGVEFSSVSSVDTNSQGHLVVLHRGTVPFLEFDNGGKLIRNYGAEGLFTRSHGLRIDSDDNMWVTDVSAHFVRKLDKDGNILMTLGTPGESGAWDEAAGRHLFDQPNETALDSAGNIYVVQGHGVAEPRVLKFSPDGKFLMQWGSRGNGPGQFAVPHSIVIDDSDTLYIADRENMRIEIFNTSGEFQNEWTYSAMVCALTLSDDGFMYMTSGFDGEFAKLNMADGALVGSLGSPGTGNGQFGEAHYLTLDAQGSVYIADVVTRRVQKYQKD